MSIKASNNRATARNPLDWRRIIAGSLTSIAIFATACLYWPATATGFRSETAVGFAYPEGVLRLTSDQKDDFRTAAVKAAGRALSGKRFAELLDQTKRLGPISTKEIQYNDFESIFSATKVGVDFEYGGGRIAIALDGQGNPDQNRFLKLLAQDVAGQINSFQIDEHDQIVSAEKFAAEKLDRAIWLANQIESDLGELSSTADRELAGYDQGQLENGPFRMASSRKSAYRDRQADSEFDIDFDDQSSSSPVSLESIDTAALQGLLSEIKNETDADRRPKSFSIASVQRVHTRGIGSTPGAAAVLLLGFAAIGFGSLVAINWEPPSEGGFDSAAALSESLGLPVLATIKGLSGSQTNAPGRRFNWANRVSEAAVSVLLIGILVLIGFGIIDPGIRESTLQNPLDGVARIFRVFFGY